MLALVAAVATARVLDESNGRQKDWEVLVRQRSESGLRGDHKK